MILKYTILLCIQLTAYCSCFKKRDVLLDTCLWLLPWFLRLKWVTFPIRYSISKIRLSPLLHVRCSKQENRMNLPVLIALHAVLKCRVCVIELLKVNLSCWEHAQLCICFSLSNLCLLCKADLQDMNNLD